MTITQAGSTVADQDFSLTCKVTVAAPLSVRPIVSWVKVDQGSSMILSNVTTLITPTTTLSTLSFKLTRHDRGTYQCIADLNMLTVTSFRIKQEYNISVQREYTSVIFSFVMSLLFKQFLTLW